MQYGSCTREGQEQRFHELKAVLEDTERQLKDAQASVDVGNADAIGLREASTPPA